MYKLVVKLKQHTPLIHFQHDQEGATLRASEVKPKLDRFLLTKLGEGATDEQLKVGQAQLLKEAECFDELDNYRKGYLIAKGLGWLIGKGDKPSMNYKLRFIIDQQPQIIDIKKYDSKNKELPYPLFFGNLKKDPENPDEYKKFSFLKEPFMAIFSCFVEDIQKEIEKNIADFYLLHNFGTRQSKGFGSFFLDVSEKDKTYYKKPDYKYSFSLAVSDNLKFNEVFIKLFDAVDLFFRSLRSGINISWGSDPFYMKPMIFRYAKSKGFQWDKKSIKEIYYELDLKDQQKEHDNPDILTFSQDNDQQKYLFKDLLGLSVLEEWKRPYSKRITKVNSEIERFRSPIIFKPLKFGKRFYVNIILEKVSQKYLGRDFMVKSNGGGSLLLKTFPEFNTEDFFDFALNTNLFSLLEFKADKNHQKYIILEEIYNELKKKKL